MSEHRPGTEELLRFILGEGLDAARRRALAAALLADPTLREDHDRLADALRDAVRARIDAAPDAAFEQRVWSVIEPKLPATRPAPRARPRWTPAFAWAAVLLLGIATASWLRPGTAPVAPPQSATTGWFADDAASRILDRELAAYFDAAATVLDAAPHEPAARARRAGALAERNRLYAAAATRGGRAVDAALLRRLSDPLDALAMGATPVESPEDLERLAFQSRGLAQRSRLAPPHANANRRS